jgi:small subunit ribosomal protein S1
LKKGQSITVRILSYDAAQKKLGLSLKRAEANPWDEIKKKYRPGSKWKLPVSHLTNFGAFVKLPEGFDGLVHLSDFSWTEKIAQPSDRVSKGQEIDVVALSVNPEGEKIAFSIKHTQPDPFTVLKVGKAVDGKVTRSEEMGIEVLLTNGLKAWVSRRECQKGRDEKEILPAVGTDISAKVIQVLPKERKVELSIRQYERDEERKAVARYTKNQERLTLGDILISSDEDDSSTES